MRDLALRRPELARLHEHPGYGCDYDYSRDDRVGEGYAAAMRQCLAAFRSHARPGPAPSGAGPPPRTPRLWVRLRRLARRPRRRRLRRRHAPMPGRLPISCATWPCAVRSWPASTNTPAMGATTTTRATTASAKATPPPCANAWPP